MTRRLLSLTLLVLMTWGSIAGAATSLQYVLPGSPVVFADSAQTPTRTWTLSALASGAGRVSQQHDKGSGSQPALWSFTCRLQLTGTNVPGAVVEFYVARGDGTNVAGEVGTADVALSSVDKRRNLTLLGSLIVDQSTSNVTMTAVFTGVYIPERFFSLVIYNATGLPLKTDTAAHRCAGTPVPYQMQAN